MKNKTTIEKEFDEHFPISIDYPPITDMEVVFTQIEIHARVKRAKAKHEEILRFIHSTRQDDLKAVRELPLKRWIFTSPYGLEKIGEEIVPRERKDEEYIKVSDLLTFLQTLEEETK